MYAHEGDEHDCIGKFSVSQLRLRIQCLGADQDVGGARMCGWGPVCGDDCFQQGIPKLLRCNDRWRLPEDLRSVDF